MLENLVTVDAALTIALALLVGVVAQSLARHLRLPGIVLLLASGVFLGPDGLGLIQPATLGKGLSTLVSFAVAVVLFEGGLNLDLRRLRREATTIRRLVILGALITALGGSLAAHYAMGWDVIPSVLFGCLVIVTGPTVITPLLRRIKVRRSVATILEAEGVLIDPVGAIIAVLALEAVIGTTGSGMGSELTHFAMRIGIGAVIGLVGGLLLALLLRLSWMIPEDLHNVFALAMVFAMFHISEAIQHESGIMAVTVAGLVFGNLRSHALRELREFKEQLTVMLIGLLFVLLAADVRIEQVQSLGKAGIITVLLLMLVVRPVNIFVCTWRTGLNWRQKMFLSWLAPRGIVAAAMATLFAESLARAGLPGGEDLRALVFMVIAMTVLVQGLTGGLMARMLGLKRPSNQGYLILGANPLALALGEALQSGGDEVVLVDTNPENCHAAEKKDFKVIFGNGLEERTMLRAEVDTRSGCLGCTANEELNLLFVRHARDDFKVAHAWLAREHRDSSLGGEVVDRAGARILFGAPRALDLWSLRLGRQEAEVRAWTWSPAKTAASDSADRDTGEHSVPGEADEQPSGVPGGSPLKEVPEAVLPMVMLRGRRVQPVDERTSPRRGDVLLGALLVSKAEATEQVMESQGWVPRTEEVPAESQSS